MLCLHMSRLFTNMLFLIDKILDADALSYDVFTMKSYYIRISEFTTLAILMLIRMRKIGLIIFQYQTVRFTFIEKFHTQVSKTWNTAQSQYICMYLALTIAIMER